MALSNKVIRVSLLDGARKGVGMMLITTLIRVLRLISYTLLLVVVWVLLLVCGLWW